MQMQARVTREFASVCESWAPSSSASSWRHPPPDLLRLPCRRAAAARSSSSRAPLVSQVPQTTRVARAKVRTPLSHASATPCPLSLLLPRSNLAPHGGFLAALLELQAPAGGEAHLHFEVRTLVCGLWAVRDAVARRVASERRRSCGVASAVCVLCARGTGLRVGRYSCDHM